MEKSRVTIYTDGGCSPNPGPGGWGVVLISPDHNGHIKELSGAETQSTNNRMELTAAIMALRSLKRPCEVNLHTDSQYLKKAFTENWLNNWLRNGWKNANRKPVANKDLWLELIELNKVHNINWRWVKGHSTDIHNKRCDQLVSEAREKFIKKGKPVL
ncbi:MAG: ribonuclease HI [Candidatus Latescibacteria bacterium]|nr:ribonuclease HI [Candidatus Latescibacterota bacterium]